MTSAFDDEDLSLSISSSQPRRDSRESSGTSQHAPVPVPRAPNSHQKQPKQVERLGQYNVVKTLGEGSFGKVKLALHGVSGQKVALKVISRRKLVTRDMAGRIEREIQYLQLLRHPHIIKLFTVITLPSDIIMVLEYAGGELFDYIVQHGKMVEDKARKFFQQIVCAVEYCHRHKIVHRDLKPENLLLDDQLNVKIADFGLSNIMTDGNFLKTSCGSPNYAAPEVISGKLYAGPEVDVWSCGVILYVLLVGRLPFDDEYIPTLFKKIAQGSYVVPSYLSAGAVQLIRRMLQVNPVHRITIQEIRQDPWFTKDLADYLQPAVEDFMDTGVDPNKAIDPSVLSKGKPVVVREKMHASIVGKLGKTMGYAPDDVQEALAKDEPSAIKDAYLIVRENHLMKTNPSLAQDQPAFVAQSPPAFGSSAITSPKSPIVRLPSHPTSIDHPRHGSIGSTSKIEGRSPASTIAVLPSSLPDYHVAYMRGHKDKTSPPNISEEPVSGGRPRTKEEQEATARRLKPHSKSSANLYREKPEPMTAMPDKQTKKKQQKWQFGIRSRNTPCEAMLAIYKALAKMGAQWEVPTPKERGAPGSSEGSPERQQQQQQQQQRRRRQQEGSQSPEYSDSDPDPGTDPEYATHEEQERRRRARGTAQGNKDGRGQGRGRERFGRWNDYGYDLPEDPWVIHARFWKKGMYPPGVAHPSSTHSSFVDLLGSGAGDRRGSSAVSSATMSHTGSVENMAAVGPGAGSGSAGSDAGFHPPVPSESAWVYVTIQLYCIEKDFYLVDFKCAGYERLVKRFAREVNGSKRSDVATDSESPNNTTRLQEGESRRDDGDDGDDGDGDDEDDHHDDDNRDEEGRYANNSARRGREQDVDGEAEREGQEVAYDEQGDEVVGAGRSVDEKDISSPFPFLDIASRLIIQLAEAQD